APAVVNIFSKKVVRQRGLSPLFSDPFFRRFFGDEFGGFGVPRERVQSSLGSGVIVSEDGLIVTNHHVIGEADEITVVLSDRREFPAELVLDDERTDLAVLRVDPGGKPLPHVEFRDSDEVEVGDLVLAVGNPFGVGQTVTSGIVSALARTQVGISDYSFFIQTDAAINPGNSGGALVTLDGKLLGINTAIYSKNGGSVGIGFAIPSNMVRTVVSAARRGGKLVRGWTGLVGQDVTPDLAEGLGLDRPGGVIVNRIYPGGPADRAGLRQADVILEVEGFRVEDVKALRFRIATRELGQGVQLTVLRGGERIALEFPVEAAPESPPRDVTPLEGTHPLAGAVVANLSPALSEELELPGRWDGVILLDTVRGSPARRLGFRPGDILLSVNDYEVGEVDGLVRELEQRAVRWRIAFRRDGEVRRVEFNL
ncbi:MAG TPA: Do family serine endopeptidase, partial [Kiloniellales bacterium]|nr:Do family serine endopeptidase [Kiloniellales bacterium]